MILIDADACPVVRETERLAEKYGIECTLFCDTSHILHSEYSDVKVIGAGADAVDFAVITACIPGDIIITQDYGVAAMALGKGAYAFHQSGMQYTNENIDQLLLERHMAKKAHRCKLKRQSICRKTLKATRRLWVKSRLSYHALDCCTILAIRPLDILGNSRTDRYGSC